MLFFRFFALQWRVCYLATYFPVFNMPFFTCHVPFFRTPMVYFLPYYLFFYFPHAVSERDLILSALVQLLACPNDLSFWNTFLIIRMERARLLHESSSRKPALEYALGGTAVEYEARWSPASRPRRCNPEQPLGPLPCAVSYLTWK